MRSCVIVMLLLCDQIKQVRRPRHDATWVCVCARARVFACACVRVFGGRIRTQLKLRYMWLKEVQGNKEKSNLLQANPPTTTRCLHA